jgi:hypothetical protein
VTGNYIDAVEWTDEQRGMICQRFIRLAVIDYEELYSLTLILRHLDGIKRLAWGVLLWAEWREFIFRRRTNVNELSATPCRSGSKAGWLSSLRTFNGVNNQRTTNPRDVHMSKVANETWTWTYFYAG